MESVNMIADSLVSPQDDGQIFEITDFTTATDWERFVADLEEILRKWKLQLDENHLSKTSNQATENSGTLCKPEVLKFGKVSLLAMLHVYHPLAKDDPENEENLGLLRDMMDSNNDFPHRSHCIYRWFGVKMFILISPMENELINSNERLKLLLSSAAIAMNNTSIFIPVFVQLHQHHRKYFHGILEASTFRINFDMIHVKSMPEDYRYLSELVNLFREKLACPLVDRPSIEVSVRFTHVLNEWPSYWIEDNYRAEFNLQDRLHNLNKSPLNILEYQHANNPINELHLSASWCSLSEEIVSDSPHHSNLDPMDAPKWTARAVFKDNFSKDLVHSLENLLSMAKSSKHSDQVLGQFSEYQEERESEARAALDKLASPPSLTLPQIKTSPRLFISNDLRDRIIRFLFSKTDHIDSPELVNTVLKDYRSFKSSPFNSLTWRLAILFYHLKDFNSLAYMWGEVTKELRDHWEALVLLPNKIHETSFESDRS